QGWEFSGDGSNPPAVMSGGSLHETTTAGGRYWFKLDSSVDFSRPFTLEARLRVNSSSEIPNVGTGTREGYYFTIFNGDNVGSAYSIGLADAGFNVNTIKIPNHPLTPFPIAGAFHTYRFEIVNSH